MYIRQVEEKDLPMLVEIEQQGFTPEEAATKEAFIQRIQQIPDTFLVAESAGEIVGYVNGPVISKRYITDDLFTETMHNPHEGGYASILGLAVSKKARKQGIAAKLLKVFEEQAKKHKRQGVTLTCKEELIPFYEHLGYTNEGIAESVHGGVVWYNMVKEFV
ncbi:GNAT family N-acetyltransferase [Kurthia sp. YJT4]|uniref:GNAT family N-acetyltransferase n=1 Tax=Kurthia sp. YJT4 TaxID=3049086 RepID=UPI00254FCD8B|nr:GNAT family N-acetyltransferase [Kurthia sp. YJT4]WIL39807.1 GNAT family N-acetyltransferase [Kurthia sp. YJT4]